MQMMKTRYKDYDGESIAMHFHFMDFARRRFPRNATPKLATLWIKLNTNIYVSSVFL